MQKLYEKTKCFKVKFRFEVEKTEYGEYNPLPILKSLSNLVQMIKYYKLNELSQASATHFESILNSPLSANSSNSKIIYFHYMKLNLLIKQIKFKSTAFRSSRPLMKYFSLSNRSTITHLITLKYTNLLHLT